MKQLCIKVPCFFFALFLGFGGRFIATAGAQAITLTASPQALTVYPGQGAVPIQVTLSSDTSVASVDVTVTGLPSGITVSPSPLTLTPGMTGQLVLTVQSNAATEQFSSSSLFNPNTATSPAQIVGVGRGIVVSTPLQLTVSLTNPGFSPAPSAITLPILSINTSNVPITLTSGTVTGSVTITSANGQTSYLPSASNTDNIATFEVHGNSTSYMPKLAYNMKLDASLDLLNVMGLSCPYVTSSGKATCDKSKSYVLLANYDDKTMLRDWSASALANSIPMGGSYLTSKTGSPTPSGTKTLMPWAPHSLYVELFLNGVYEGIYQLIEKVGVDSHKVNISELAQTDMTDDITGGYLFEMDQRHKEDYNFVTPQGVYIGLLDPDFSPEVPEQTSYISQYVTAAEGAMFSANYTSATLGWRAYFDEASLINFYLVNEVMGNVDAGDFVDSNFLYKSKDNPLIYLGPVWDFDISSGNVNYEPIVSPTVPWMQVANPWFPQLFTDPSFKADVVKQFNTLKSNGIFSTWISSIASQAATLENAQVNNFTRWPMLNEFVWPNPQVAGSYDSEVAYLTNYVNLRIAYLDSIFNGKKSTATAVSIPTGNVYAGTTQSLVAKVSGGTSPTGAVSFFSGATLLGIATLNSSQVATLVTNGLPIGYDSITAVYSGDNTNALSSSSGAGVQVLSPLVQTMTSLVVATPIYTGSSTTLSASVLGISGTNTAPTGSVSFTSNGVVVRVASLISGVASLSTSVLPSGSDTILAQYLGDVRYAASTSAAAVVSVSTNGVATSFSTFPANLGYLVDGVYYNAGATLALLAGSTHTIAVSASQAGDGAINSFAAWSDGGGISHTITISSQPKTYTAYFGSVLNNVADGNGFTAGAVTLNGTANLNGSRLRLTDGGNAESASAYAGYLVNVSGFTNDFTFQLTNAQADGFTFVIQNQGSSVLGQNGGDLGYGEGSYGIQQSVAIKFDLYNSKGEGADSTGLYINGAAPTLPATDLTPSGVDLHSGNVLHAHMTYDGVTLTVILTDTVSGATATQTYLVDIPAVVGANTAYVGFTAGTGGLSAVQEILTWTFAPQSVIPAPVFSIAGGSYNAPQTVSLTDTNTAAAIFYTLDATTPTATSAPYTVPLSITSTTTVSAIAVLNGSASTVSTSTYTIAVPAPVFSIAGGSYNASQTVSLTDTNTAAAIFYTLDGTTPTASSTPYTVPLPIAATTTVSAIAVLNGNASTVSTSTYTIAVPAPVFSIAGGSYNAPQTVSLTDTNTAAAIFYTLDATTPTASSTPYTVPLPIAATTTVSAIAVLNGNASTVSTSTYTIAVPAPVFSIAGGSYNAPQTVSLTDTNTAAAIFYTLDATTPTASSTPYTVPLPIAATTTVSAIAVLNGNASTVTSITYTIAIPASASFANGFSATSLILNGTPRLNAGTLVLTSTYFQANSVYYNTPLSVQGFINDFTFQLPAPTSDGFAFVFQNQGPSAVGANGGDLGYGEGLAGIQQSVAIKFDLHDNDGEGANSTGIYNNGVRPTLPAINLNSTSFNLHSGNVLQAHMTYDGVTLAVTMTDTLTGATASQSYTVDIPSIVGANSAYVGFTAGTGTTLTTQNILTWTYTPQTFTAAPVFSLASGAYSSSQTVTLTDSATGASIFYTLDGTAPTASSPLYTAPLSITATTTVSAIAVLNGTASPASTRTYIIRTADTGIAYPTGFSAGSLTLNGAAKLTGSRLRLTDGGSGESAAAYTSYPTTIGGFTNDFTFQLTNAHADGFTFVIQNQGPSALGGNGGDLGYGEGSSGIQQSVAIKFDLYNNDGEGTDSTGLYLNGIRPTLPATDLTATAFNLHSGNVLRAHMTYDGVTLTVILTDTVTGATATQTYPVNIPAIVGANTAYIGFTAGTGGLSAIQDILTWTFAPQAVTPPPLFSVPGGTYTAAQTVSLSDTATAAGIFYTLDGTTPTASSIPYTAPLSITAATTVSAIAVLNGAASGVITSTYTFNNPANGAVYATGFSAGSLTLNGAAKLTGSRLRLTDGGSGESAAAYTSYPTTIGGFTNDFTFQLTNAHADGFTFVIQNQGPSALGGNGGDLGYGEGSSGIQQSVAIKFDLYNNDGEGTDSTGLYLNGIRPTLPATDLTATAFNLHSGNVLRAHMTYDGVTLTVILTDTVTGATATQTYPVNIPAIVGANTAYIGFTAGTGGLSAIQDILTWTFAPQAVTPPPLFSVPGGTYTAAQTVSLSDTATAAGIFYTLDGTTPTASSIPYTAPLSITAATTVSAIAVLNGAASGVITSTYTFNNPANGAVYATGFSAGSLTLNGAAKLTGSRLRLTDGGSGESAAAYTSYPTTIGGFTNDFTFQLTNAHADGFTFVIQNQGPSALGGNGGDLGYGEGSSGIQQSVAIKFDLYNNDGEGTDSTGLYLNGIRPTLPATDLTATAFNLHSGNVLRAHMTYDGVTLTVILTDTVTGATATQTYPVNIPAIVGANTAYIGFTAGTGGLSAIQDILTWTFAPQAVTPPPLFSVPGGTYTAAQTVSLSDTATAAGIFYTLDGTTPTASSIPYTAPLSITAATTVSAIAVLNGAASGVITSTYTFKDPANGADYGSGFSTGSLILNGAPVLNAGRLVLTSGTYQANSVYYNTPLNVQTFTNDFTFQLPIPTSDGFTFVFQNQGPSAVGANGGDLGYGEGPAGIQQSLAIKFDLHNNDGEGVDSTGIYTNGVRPTLPSTDLTSTGFNLRSGNLLRAHMNYDGLTLTVILTDTVSGATATQTYPVNIPAIVGANTAYVGFTAGTGTTMTTQNILTWTFTPQPVIPAPVFSVAGGGYSTPQTVSLSDTATAAGIFYTLDGTTPTAGSILYTAPLSITATTTVSAIAVFNGTPSTVSTSTYTISTPAP